MGNRPHNTKYIEARNVCAGISGGRASLKPEVVPGLMAWILMLSRRYCRQAQAMRDKMVLATVPQMEGAAKRMDQAAEHLVWLARAVPQNFTREEYRMAAEEVAKLLGLRPGMVPGFDLEFDEGFTLFTAPVDDAEQDAARATVQRCVAPGEGAERPGDDAGQGGGGGDRAGDGPGLGKRRRGKRSR